MKSRLTKTSIPATAKPVTAQAVIDKGFKITTVEDAMYFAWMMDTWFKMHFVNDEPDNSFSYNWVTCDIKMKHQRWALKCSLGEPYTDNTLPFPGITMFDLVLANIKADGIMHVRCKAETDNISFFAYQIYHLRHVIAGAIKKGVFNDVSVSISDNDCSNQTLPPPVRQTLKKLISERRIEKIENLEKLWEE
ncbi:hypothetical protein [uncultured Pontibacter sp.]|uniref:hypothetical protein n=1 Tax=uncultured Pontibacter sp. TaxID=453356 RepID=UPI0026244DC8|nr:hypothetical protein [uncultured Pontibacter sp.]